MDTETETLHSKRRYGIVSRETDTFIGPFESEEEVLEHAQQIMFFDDWRERWELVELVPC